MQNGCNNHIVASGLAHLQNLAWLFCRYGLPLFLLNANDGIKNLTENRTESSINNSTKHLRISLAASFVGKNVWNVLKGQVE